MDQEHEVYGGEIPDEEGEMEADEDMAADDQDPQSSKENLEEMKKRLKEIVEEAGALREMQAKVEKEMAAVQEDSSSGGATQAEKEEVDSRSIYVGNVDYACIPEEVQQHFQSCGTVNRVTILTDKFGQPKGFAYVEFVEVDAVQNALLLNESELHGRQLKVSAKRTNIPGMKQYRGRRANPYMAFRSRRPYMPPPFYSPFGYGNCTGIKHGIVEVRSTIQLLQTLLCDSRDQLRIQCFEHSSKRVRNELWIADVLLEGKLQGSGGQRATGPTTEGKCIITLSSSGPG